jgi:hypothetical protein
LLGHGLDDISGVVEIVVITTQSDLPGHGVGRKCWGGQHTALAGRNVGVQRRGLSNPVPADLKLFAFGVGGIADANANGGPCGRAHIIVGVHHPLQAGIGRALGFDRFDNNFKSAWPFVTLQTIQSAAFLQVGDQHDAIRPGILVASLHVLDGFRSGNQRAAEMGRTPGRFVFGQPLCGQRGARGNVLARPLLEVDHRSNLIVEHQNRDLVGRSCPVERGFGFVHGGSPHAVALHARADVHQQNDLCSDRICGSCGHRLLEKRARKGEGQQADDQAAQQQKQNVFEAVAPRHAWRGGFEKHQRTEHEFLARRPANEVKHHRQRNGESTEQK